MKSVVKKLCSTAMISTWFFLSPVVFASQEVADTAKISGFAGSILASRVAMDDNDDASAVQFLERALDFDKENVRLKQDLFIAYTANGQIEDAATLANEKIDFNSATNLRGFVLASNALRKRSFKKVPAALETVAVEDANKTPRDITLDLTVREITQAWAYFGDAEFDKANKLLNGINGAELFGVIRDYHEGLMASLNGDSKLAQSKFQAVIDNRAMISVLTETYLRAIEAKIRSHIIAGEKDAARETLDYGYSLIAGHYPFRVLEAALNEDKVLKPLVTSPQQGVAELFYNIASAVQRNTSGNLVKPFFQLAYFLNPKSDVVKMSLGDAYAQESDYERSNSYFDDVTETSAYFRRSRIEKASNLAMLEKGDEAITVLQTLIETDPSDINAYMVLGTLYNRKDEYAEAIKVYTKAVNVLENPQRSNWNLFYRRGAAHERLKQWDEAEADMLRALELSKDQPEVLNHLGYSWVDRGLNLERGIDMIRKAVQLRPRSGYIVDSLGWAYYRLGKYDNAVRELERAVALTPNDPTINDHLGDAYWKVGRKLEATFQWRIALASKIEPENPDLIRKKLEVGLVEDDVTKTSAEND